MVNRDNKYVTADEAASGLSGIIREDRDVLVKRLFAEAVNTMGSMVTAKPLHRQRLEQEFYDRWINQIGD